MPNRTSVELKKQLNSPYLKSQTKCVAYETLTRPILTHGSEWCSLSLKEGWKYAPNLRKKNIKNDVGPIDDNGVWRTT